MRGTPAKHEAKNNISKYLKGNSLIKRMEKYDIKNLEKYKITKDGRIWSEKSNRFLTSRICNGYNMININNRTLTIHRLVAETFIPNPNNKPYVNHINCNKIDNRVDNLEWVTQKENCEKHNKLTSHPKKIIQMDSNNNIINKFNSLKEASIHIKLSPSSISKALLKINKTAGGYIWNYENVFNILLDLKNGKPIYGNNKYYIFPDGTVYNTVRKSKIKPIKNASGYCYVTISNRIIKKNYYIHRIVAEHFINNDNINIKTQVNHKNKIRDDNKIENLEWVTPSNNMLHANSSLPSL